MLDLDTRIAILRLHRAGHGSKRIAKALGVSRNAVRRVLRSGEATVPPLERSEQLSPHIDRVRELHAACKGNLVRVHEELADEGIEVGYATLTRFCRRYHIGHAPPQAAGTYDFAPGVEMQHDTSPHQVKAGDRTRRVECASLILGYSRVQYAQVYHREVSAVRLTEARRSHRDLDSLGSTVAGVECRRRHTNRNPYCLGDRSGHPCRGERLAHRRMSCLRRREYGWWLPGPRQTNSGVMSACGGHAHPAQR